MKTWYELFKDKITMVVSLGLLSRLEVMDRPIDSVEHPSGTYALKRTGGGAVRSPQGRGNRVAAVPRGSDMGDD